MIFCVFVFWDYCLSCCLIAYIKYICFYFRINHCVEIKHKWCFYLNSNIHNDRQHCQLVEINLIFIFIWFYKDSYPWLRTRTGIILIVTLISLNMIWFSFLNCFNYDCNSTTTTGVLIRPFIRTHTVVIQIAQIWCQPNILSSVYEGGVELSY